MTLELNPLTGKFDLVDKTHGNAFTIITGTGGTSPTADSDADTLTFVSSDGSISVTGDSATDQLDLVVTASGKGTLQEVVNNGNTSSLSIFIGGSSSINFGNGDSKIFNADVDEMTIQTADLFFKGANIFIQDDKLLFFSNVGNTIFKAIDGGAYFGGSRVITLPDLSGTIIVDVDVGGGTKNIRSASFIATKGIDLNTWALLNSPIASVVEIIGRDEPDDETIIPTTINIIGGIDTTSIGSRGGAVNLKWGSSLNGIQGQAGFFQDSAKIYSMDINGFKPESTVKDLGTSSATERWNIIYLDSTINFATGMTIVRSTNNFLYNAVTSHQFQTGVLQTDNAVNSSITALSANTTLNATHHIVTVDASGAGITITLPAVSGITGRVYHIKKIDSSVNAVIVDGNASETIDGATTQVIGFQYDSMMIIAGTSEWSII